MNPFYLVGKLLGYVMLGLAKLFERSGLLQGFNSAIGDE